jgi:hypothetical protein
MDQTARHEGYGGRSVENNATASTLCLIIIDQLIYIKI